MQIEVAKDAALQTRYRAATDETNAGSETPEEALAKAQGQEAKAKPRTAAKPPHTELSDLRPGLWVEVEYGKKDGKNCAFRLTILRPVGDPQSGPVDLPKDKKK
ncbi:MAG: hypothetical protein IRY99_17095 [Isosphaeraceae bacterium]|nr:hypothetical protein [Isosphaeraceae bacterium]